MALATGFRCGSTPRRKSSTSLCAAREPTAKARRSLLGQNFGLSRSTLKAPGCLRVNSLRTRDSRSSLGQREGTLGGAIVAALHQLALRRVEENRPLLPWIVERALQFFEIAHYPETALSIGMIEWAGGGCHQLLN